MALDHSLVGVESDPATNTWTSSDAIRYALGVGAGLGDPTRELAFTTENSQDVEQRVLPTYGVILTRTPTRRKLGDFDPAMLVHAEQGFELHGPIPVEGSVRVTTTVTGIYDKGSGALVTSRARAVDADTGVPMVTATSAVFIRGEGGFGGDRGPSSGWQRPQRQPDHQVRCETRPEQALLYRLSGDRNPLHSDPKFAARAGFPRPILHGLCTYGFTGRALLHALCGSDPARFVGMEGRFTKPVLPGDSLLISIWDGHGTDGTTAGGHRTAAYQTATEDGTVVIDRGLVRYR